MAEDHAQGTLRAVASWTSSAEVFADDEAVVAFHPESPSCAPAASRDPVNGTAQQKKR